MCQFAASDSPRGPVRREQFAAANFLNLLLQYLIFFINFLLSGSKGCKKLIDEKLIAIN